MSPRAVIPEWNRCPASSSSGPACILVIARASDTGALRVVRELERRRRPVKLISPDELLLAPFWRHDPFGETVIKLGSGYEICDEQLASVFNRIDYVDPPQFARAGKRDKQYAQAEFHSLILSWLTQLGDKVINRPHAASLPGDRRSALQDHLWLAAHDMPAATFTVASHSRCLSATEGVTTSYYHPTQDESALSTRERPHIPLTLLTEEPVIQRTQHTRSTPKSLVLVDDQIFGDDVSPAAMAMAHRIGQLRGLQIASIAYREDAAGVPEGCVVDPMPPLSEPGVVSAIAQRLSDRQLEPRCHPQGVAT